MDPATAALAAQAIKEAADAAKSFVKGLASDVSAAASSVVNFIPGSVSPRYSSALVAKVQASRLALVDAVIGDLAAKACDESTFGCLGAYDPKSRGGRTANLLNTLAQSVGVPGSERATLRARVYERFHNGPRRTSELAEAKRQAEIEAAAGFDVAGLNAGVVVGAAVGAALGYAIAGKVGAAAGAVAGGVAGSKVKF
jgi:hypothetical protein